MRLKAIANPGDKRGGSRWRSHHPAKRRRPPGPARGSVLDAVRLLLGSGSALEGAYLLEDRAATRSFSPLEAEAGHDSAVEPIEPATSQLIGSPVSEPRILVTIQRANIGGCSPASDRIGNEQVAA
jgi:hypothetical protein